MLKTVQHVIDARQWFKFEFLCDCGRAEQHVSAEGLPMPIMPYWTLERVERHLYCHSCGEYSVRVQPFDPYGVGSAPDDQFIGRLPGDTLFH